MKVNVIGSHLCTDTLYALVKLKDKKIEVEFEDISSSFPSLKAFLKARENNPIYNNVKKNGGIGIPFFTLEDGTRTFELDEVLKKIMED
ncbi:hypothetical protein CLHOM_09620 [Clostridium homopropionicum DSM 5847]|uniref:Glutaredoxin n=1 Tax=Clostridium homopropionicum DSM 5847 TaxID=1121318 RepID=A0A0L6ZCW6_9CLOT|nr:glutaredoxin [Clostridium homopropionicum]KOA20819.1 hypothetical protein CLHOM_09620 [Clostridium homopropionicum DSM 5847]SFF88338.1 Glutaredoxin-related protein [Clostridium homopropionicum]